VIAGVVDAGEQFITGDNDTGNNFVAGGELPRKGESSRG
jgi:hypothetical protein